MRGAPLPQQLLQNAIDLPPKPPHISDESGKLHHHQYSRGRPNLLAKSLTCLLVPHHLTEADSWLISILIFELLMC